MDINMTILGQTIAMIVFVWFCMKYIWPPVMMALDERRKTIADGLAAAEQGQQDNQAREEWLEVSAALGDLLAPLEQDRC